MERLRSVLQKIATLGSPATLMVYFHYRTRIRIPTRTRTPKPMATLCYAETVPIAQSQSWIPIQLWITDHCCIHFGMDICTQIEINANKP